MSEVVNDFPNKLNLVNHLSEIFIKENYTEWEINTWKNSHITSFITIVKRVCYWTSQIWSSPKLGKITYLKSVLKFKRKQFCTKAEAINTTTFYYKILLCFT
jgi:hypothetical protein